MGKVDISGQKFGRLVAQRRISVGKHSHWLCVCECGREKVIALGSLRRGLSRSCGCLGSELSQARHLTHGETSKGRRTTEYRAYESAKRRCSNPRQSNYPNYGGRGIKFLFTSFGQFLTEVGRKPTPEHSLDRRNNDGNYEPGNSAMGNGRRAAS